MPDAITLPASATMADYQRYIHQLEAMHGWLDVDLVHNGFLMTEEVGELFAAIRAYERLFPEQTGSSEQAQSIAASQGNAAQQTEAAADAAQGAPQAEGDVAQQAAREQARAAAAEEVVDVLNYLLAIANRLDVDVEQAFRDKNARNQQRTWG